MSPHAPARLILWSLGDRQAGVRGGWLFASLAGQEQGWHLQGSPARPRRRSPCARSAGASGVAARAAAEQPQPRWETADLQAWRELLEKVPDPHRGRRWARSGACRRWRKSAAGTADGRRKHSLRPCRKNWKALGCPRPGGPVQRLRWAYLGKPSRWSPTPRASRSCCAEGGDPVNAGAAYDWSTRSPAAPGQGWAWSPPRQRSPGAARPTPNILGAGSGRRRFPDGAPAPPRRSAGCSGRRTRPGSAAGGGAPPSAAARPAGSRARGSGATGADARPETPPRPLRRASGRTPRARAGRSGAPRPGGVVPLHDTLPACALVALAQGLAQLPSGVPVPAQLPGQLQRGESVLGLKAEVEGQAPRGPGQPGGHRGCQR